MKLEKKLSKALKSNNSEVIHSVFGEIYCAYGKLAYFIISKYVSNKEDIEDLTQEVFVSFYNQLGKNQIDNIKYYLAVSAKNQALNFLKKAVDTQPIDESVITAGGLGFSEFSDLTETFKKYISETEIEIIYAHCVYGLKFNEIAELLCKPLNTVISAYNRAVKKLKGGNFNE